MRLDPIAFNSFLGSVGQDAQWRKSFACPCVAQFSGNARQDCPHCSGFGHLWSASKDGKAAVAGRDAQKKWAQFGRWDSGDVVISIPSDSALYAIGEFDRVSLINRTEPFSMNVVDGINQVIRFPVVSVDRVCWLNGDVLVDGPLPTVLPDGSLDWTAGAPPDDVTYSVTGRRRAEHFVFFEMPSDRPHHAGATLPRRVVLRRFDLFKVA